jgi:Fe-S-cluster-containing dehydrogenase component/DMSO reductase anchor subunit
VSLPLLKRAVDDGVTFVMTPRAADPPPPFSRGLEIGLDRRMPSHRPGAGEQYRFHVDMRRCIGCKCCVVACNEQNGNPAAINWRRVAEIEGGPYPFTHRSYLSMGCNHCVNPTCLAGCPVDAYTKDPDTGIVRHSAEECIGCQYCTWTCSYGVPQYNPERGVVGKCDMCHGRLELGQAPACVSACPEGAIQIEIVKTDGWRAAVANAATGQGLPVGDASVSTTRITVRPERPREERAVEPSRVAPAHVPWSLVTMTVLTQLSVGGFVTLWVLQLAGAGTNFGRAAFLSLLIAIVALNSATLHLGRPIHAYRALRMWRRSWLSRVVLLFALFSGASSLYVTLLWIGLPASAIAGAATAAIGIAGVTASGCIYRVPSRPAWHSPLTPAHFLTTAAVLGPLLAVAAGAASPRQLAPVAAALATGQLAMVFCRFRRLSVATLAELRKSAQLLRTELRHRFIVRAVLLMAGGIALPLLAAGPRGSLVALGLVLAGETIDRYLFFASAVPRHMASPYVQIASAA